MTSFSSAQERNSVYFADRQEAGEKLAQAVLDEISHNPLPENAGCVVYALPRGGLPVAAPVARALDCSLDMIVAKKITRPDNPELAIGAVTSDGQVIWAPHRRSLGGLLQQQPTPLEQAQEKAQQQWQNLAPQGERQNPRGAIALLVDDGIATGMTIAVAAQSLRVQQAAQIWICAPVAPPELMPFLRQIADRVIILATPTPFQSVSRFYEEFHQLTTEEAAAYLHSADPT
jgi:predicted phosphoribosyltransferase